MEKRLVENAVTSYDVDFYRWSQEIAERIRQGRLDAVEREHVAEEIEDMGKRDQREMQSRLTVLVMHLLKWQLQPELREKSSWLATIVEQRRQITLVLRQSPSLQRVPEDELPLIYMDAVRDAIKETQLPEDCFPPSCPYTWQEVLDSDFFPGGPFRSR